VWVHIKDVEAEAWLGRELKASEEVRLKDVKQGLRLENLEVYDTKTKTVVPFSAGETDTKELEVTR